MRILRVITRLNIGGPSIQAISLTVRLAERGHVTALLHGRLDTGEGDMNYLAPPGASLTLVPSLGRPISVLDDLRALWRVYSEMRRFEPTIVHTHMAKAGMVGRVAAAAYNITRGAKPRAKVVHTYHGHVLEGYFSRVMSAVFVTIERVLAYFTDAIVAISPAIRDELLQMYRIGDAAKYRVVPLGFDLDAFAVINPQARIDARRRLEIPPSAPVISTVGRLTAIKQHDLFLDVVERVAASRPSLVALIAGDGDLRHALEARAAERGIAANVRFLGWRRDLDTIYGASDVFVLTSRNEGTPVALIEAMASGLPGVSTNVGGVKDVIESDGVGRLAPPGDGEALARAVGDLLADPELREEMGTRARAAVFGRFGQTRLVADIDALYRELLARG